MLNLVSFLTAGRLPPRGEAVRVPRSFADRRDKSWMALRSPGACCHRRGLDACRRAEAVMAPAHPADRRPGLGVL